MGWTDYTRGTSCQILLLWSWPPGFNRGTDPATGTKHTLHDCPRWFHGTHHVFQHLVYDVFLKDAQIAIVQQVFLKRLEFQAKLAGHVADFQNAEIGQASLGTDRGELRHVNENFVSGKLVGPGIDFRETMVQPGFCVIVGIACTM